MLRPTGGADGLGAFHVVSLEKSGFVVTSGDTEVAPILAFSEDGEFVASEENPLWFLLTQDVAGRTKRLEEEKVLAAKSAKNAKNLKAGGFSANASAWARLRDAATASPKPLLKAALPKQSSISDLRVGPLCEARWAQGDVNGEHCYNYYTPSNCVCGCVATAFAQILYTFKWPQTKVEIGDHWYHRYFNDTYAGKVVYWYMGKDPTTGNVYGIADNSMFPEGPDFGGPYDWDNMPANPLDAASAGTLTEDQRREIGKLCRDCGISIHTRYRADASSAATAHVRNRLVDQFGYANAEVAYNVTAKDFINAMQGSFDIGSPCAVEIDGHEIVGDGYGYSDGRLYIHFNYGWGNSSYTAWYSPPDDSESDSDYPGIKQVVYNIWTPETCTATNLTIVSGRIVDETGEPACGVTVTATDRKDAGVQFSATTNDKGIYALLLPPEATYEIAAESEGGTARTFRRVGRCVSNEINEEDRTLGEKGAVGNIPGVDLVLSEDGPEAERWIEESASSSQWTGEWSQGVDYDADGRAYFWNNEFVPFSASTGNVVTVDFKSRFDVDFTDDAPGEDAQAAVRLGTNGCFQVWSKTGNGVQGTGNGWIDVEADGVTPVSGEEYTLRATFDYAARTYSVDVNGSALQLQLETPTRSFPLAAQASRVSSVAFMGETYFTSMNGDCRLEIVGEFATNEVVMLKDNAPFILNTAKAAWLNKLGAKPAVEGKLSGMALDDVTNAYLLNLDIASLDDVDGSYSFEITDIDVGDASVTVAVTLTRTGKVEQSINGTLKFYGAATLEEFKTAAAPIGTVTLSDEGGDFSEGDTTTATFEKDGNTIFNAKIEDK